MGAIGTFFLMLSIHPCIMLVIMINLYFLNIILHRWSWSSIQGPPVLKVYIGTFFFFFNFKYCYIGTYKTIKLYNPINKWFIINCTGMWHTFNTTNFFSPWPCDWYASRRAPHKVCKLRTCTKKIGGRGRASVLYVMALLHYDVCFIFYVYYHFWNC